jgi:transposase
MLRSKNVEKVEEWIEKANNLNIRKIDKFVNGLKRDMQAVRNAIIYEYNNGLAEDSVNKLVDRIQQLVEGTSIWLTIHTL